MRKPWHEYFLDIADVVASRSTCDRAHVGAVLVRDKRIVACGYNGSPPGEPHCDDVGHLMIDHHCRRTIHAECNAIDQCKQQGIPTEGLNIYVSHKPCPDCTKELQKAGIVITFYRREYGSDS